MRLRLYWRGSTSGGRQRVSATSSGDGAGEPHAAVSSDSFRVVPIIGSGQFRSQITDRFTDFGGHVVFGADQKFSLIPDRRYSRGDFRIRPITKNLYGPIDLYVDIDGDSIWPASTAKTLT